MDHYKDAFEKVIQSINWRKIKTYHKKLNILWEVEDDKQIIKRVPTAGELRDELRSIFEHMLSQDLAYISYGNWIIFWDREESISGDIRAIFRIADFIFEEDKKSLASLEIALAKAVENEDYENAAKIRDTLHKKAISK
jgi:excinuclease UvrABC helicase subunit UvrB